MNKKSLCFLCFIICFVTLAQTSNIDFELSLPGAYTGSNSVSGWTITSQTTTNNCGYSSNWVPGSSEFSIVTTPITAFPSIGTIPNSPLGGSQVARLNSLIANGGIAKISKTFSVTGNVTLYVAFAGLWQDGGHACCDQTSFKILLKDAQDNVLNCSSYSVSFPGSACQSGSTGYSVTTSGSITSSWTNWQIKYIDLSPYVGSSITLEITNCDCTFGDHYGTLFVDADLQISTPVNYCAGSSQAVINGPFGSYTYQWYTPQGILPPPQGTMSSLTVLSPSANSVYTLIINAAVGSCSATLLYTITPSQVSISTPSSYPTCSLGSTGSAIVVGSGSGTGYNYQWLNSNSLVVGTTSLASNLSAGIYSVNVSALGSSSAICGYVSSTVIVSNASPVATNQIKEFCGNEAYLSLTNGSNYQWYAPNQAAISSSLGGTSPSYTVIGPSNQDIYTVSYNNNYGCRDSIRITLLSATPGSLIIPNNTFACPNSTNGTAQITLVPSNYSPPGSNSYSVFSTGNTPAYSSSSGPTSSTAYTISGLSAGGTYSISASDGLCKYTKSFSVTPYVFDYTVTPASATLCPGSGAMAAVVNFSSPYYISQYTYSWTPSTYLFGTTTPNIIIMPIVSQAPVATYVYSVVVTPVAINCPLIKTLSITVVNPVTPTLNTISPFCSNASPFNIIANPSGGTFVNITSASIGTLSGILNPSLASIGVNTFSYANGIGTCVATSSGTFMVNAAPSITISGNIILCKGQSATLLASGADSYTWSNFSTTPFTSIPAVLTSTYSVQGTNLITNCSSVKKLTVTVVPQPTLSISGNTLLCLGESASLTVNGASNYNWSNGNSNPLLIVSPNTTTSYLVQGTTSLGSCTSTETVMVYVSSCTGFSEEVSSSDFVTIFPNPTNGEINLGINETSKWLLTNTTGEIILEGLFENGKQKIDLSSYANGIYILKVSSMSQTNITKIIKTD